MKKILLPALLLLAACGGKKQPESVPQPKAAEGAAAPAVSSAAVQNNPLKAPGDYLKTTVGRVAEAKAAKALFERTAREEAAADVNATGGN
jgi:hypothetical protein